MAFNTNTVQKQKNQQLFYGIGIKSFSLLPYVNLDNEGKKKLGLRTFENEPEYVIKKKDKEGNSFTQSIIELYIRLDNDKLKEDNLLKDTNGTVYPIRFYIDDVEAPMSQKGNYCFLNNNGNFAWGPSLEEASKVSYIDNTEGLSRAFIGESDFLKTLRNLFNIKRGGFSRFNVKKFFNGDFSELKKDIKSAIEAYPDNKITLLAYVKEKEKEIEGVMKKFYIQQFYLKAFTPNAIRKELSSSEERGYPLKGYYLFDGEVINKLLPFDINDFNKTDEDDNNFDDLPF